MSAIKVNGTRKITDLTAATTINDADALMIETSSGSRKVTGATLKELINDGVVDGISIIAPEFDSTLNYSTGDYVYSDGKLYRFTADHATGALDGSDTVEVTVTGDMVNDVQINGTSIVSGGIANIPIASSSINGVVNVQNAYGLTISNSGRLQIVTPSSEHIKGGTHLYRPITPSNQHEAVFYGLAKAAGDITQSASDNAVGTYTTEAKSAICSMLGVDSVQTVTVSGTDVTINGVANTAYQCGEVTSITITPPNTGIIDVTFTSGSTVAVLSLPSTVKMPEWFDTTDLESNTFYEINISDGIYGTVMSWAI